MLASEDSVSNRSELRVQQAQHIQHRHIASVPKGPRLSALGPLSGHAMWLVDASLPEALPLEACVQKDQVRPLLGTHRAVQSPHFFLEADGVKLLFHLAPRKEAEVATPRAARALRVFLGLLREAIDLEGKWS